MLPDPTTGEQTSAPFCPGSVLVKEATDSPFLEEIEEKRFARVVPVCKQFQAAAQQMEKEFSSCVVSVKLRRHIFEVVEL